MKSILIFRNIFLRFLIISFSLSILYMRTEGNVIFYDEDEDTTEIPLSTSVTVTALPATTQQDDYIDDTTEIGRSLETTTQHGQEHQVDVTESSRSVKTTTQDDDVYDTTEINTSEKKGDVIFYDEDEDNTEIPLSTSVTVTALPEGNVIFYDEDEDNTEIPLSTSVTVTALPATTQDEQDDDYIDDTTIIGRSVETTTKDGEEEADVTENIRSMEEATTTEPPPVPAISNLELMKDMFEDLDDNNDRNLIIISTVAGCGFLLIICALLYLVYALALLKHSEKSNISHV
ncbi:hypothetical protein XELAEV_18027123mg [Xenopus laevis]|uniref:Uncharacterized protein n=1 Tax=Xenopus laevis TaxID=8355 RepID=A0A974CUX8_XENLA|nr:hypothetical protein XELAEV_18027123mg [Xenopus laevis]